MRYRYIIIIFLTLLGGIAYSQKDSISVLEKNIRIFRSYLQTLQSNYVDSINTTPLLHTGIDAMNRSLDPYTAFYDEKETKERGNAWKGYLFSGIGTNIIERDSFFMITKLYQGFPAQLAGARIGDRIIWIDSMDVKGKPIAEVVKKLKGEEGTKVIVTVQRPGIGVLQIPITRKKIMAKSVDYYGMINDSTGYIKCSQFLENAYDSMSVAFHSLRKNTKLSNLVLDLRDNQGGMVQEAVNTVNMFLPKGKVICNLKSENSKNSNYNYTTLYDPVDTTIKIVALSSNSTISAGEIVLGAFQDYDRAVIIGQRSFGKGYVQGTRSLDYNTQLYVTAARYYTPSGRCIQEIDYTHKYIDGKVNTIKDTTNHLFFTKNGRKVNASGGIEPDVKTPLESALAQSVLLCIDNNILGDFATLYRNTHNDFPGIASFSLPRKDMDEFMKLALCKITVLHTKLETEIDQVESLLQKDSLLSPCNHEIKKVKRKLQKAKIAELRSNYSILKSLLEKEILIRYYNDAAIMQYSFLHDPEIIEALRMLQPKNYSTILNNR